jgi:hypothetical protein
MWCLGCVFSIAATWVVLGYQGIRQFSNVRKKAITKINKERSSQSTLLDVPTEGDGFHDGAEVLRDVTLWHSVLRSALRATDTTTSQVLDLVDEKMLLGDSSKRLKAEEVCQELKRILDQHQAKPRKAMPESIMKSLLEMDEEAPSKSAALTDIRQPLTVPQDRKTRKSKLLHLPLMETAHRSEYLNSALSIQVGEPAEKQTVHQNPLQEDVTVRYQASRDPGPAPFTPDHNGDGNHAKDTQDLRNSGGSYFPLTPSLPPTAVRSKQHQRSKTATPQNVFQARHAIEKREKSNFLKRPRKDGLLTRHFGNRAIVSSGGSFVSFD